MATPITNPLGLGKDPSMWSQLFGKNAKGVGELMKKPGAGGVAAFLVPMILSMIVKQQTGQFAGHQKRGMELEHLKEMKGMISPEQMQYEAMMPDIEAENRLAQTLLMQQLIGRGQQLAGGESIIGGSGGY